MNINKYAIWLVMLLYGIPSFSQNLNKPVIDADVIKKWTEIGPALLGSDGKFAAYQILNQPVGTKTSVFVSTDGKWKKSFISGSMPSITSNGQFGLLPFGKDSLLILRLGTKEERFLGNISSIFVMKGDGNSCIGYLSNKPDKKLTVENLTSGFTYTFPRVSKYVFSTSGRGLILQFEDHSVHFVNCESGKSKLIYRDNQPIEEILIDETGEQATFKTKNLKGGLDIYYYKIGMDGAKKVLNGNDPKILALGKQVDLGGVKFCNDGKGIVIDFTEHLQTEKLEKVKVTVWSYKNELPTAEGLTKYKAYLDLTKDSYDLFWIIDKDIDEVVSFPDDKNWLLVRDPFYSGDGPLLFTAGESGTKKLTGLNNIYMSPRGLSPSGRYLVHYDRSQKTWKSYDTKVLSDRIIVGEVKNDWSNSWQDLPAGRAIPGIVGWAENEAVIIADEYDLWWMDLRGQHKPVNLTNGYGRRHNIVFQLALEEYKKTLIGNGEVLLHGFNTETKESGYYKMRFMDKSDPILLSKGANYNSTVIRFAIPGNFRGITPIKARNTAVYLLFQSKRCGSVNLFSTKDFKSFKPLSDIHPENDVNWYSTELFKWTTYTGKIAQGVLYKPANFDSKKKYPVIFTYYERRSDALNTFISPELFNSEANIPYLVSHDYLVFCPDILYEIGDPGVSAFKSIEPAANLISKLPYVDSLKLGLNGVSLGGYETNAIITQSKKFSAAVSACGMSNLVSTFGSIWGMGKSRQGITVTGQNRMGTTPWKDPQAYVRNSPVFAADQVETPLLMMANRKDGNVDFTQGIEFYTALWSLKKPVWLLEFENAGHGLYDPLQLIDYTTRVMQFYDHYLKGAPAPRWMTEGVKKKYRQVDYQKGLELDYSGNKP